MYDREARLSSSQAHQNAKRRRASGPSFQLKQYHNAVKRELIAASAGIAPRRVGSGYLSLLDIGCGRGGDISKWLSSRIDRVVAIDSSRASIEEAKRRWNDTRKPRKSTTSVSFHHVSDLGTSSSPSLPSSPSPPSPPSLPSFPSTRPGREEQPRRCLTTTDSGDVGAFSIVTCMFAVQYFFESHRMLDTLMRTISDSLLPGGVFVGCAPDARAIRAFLRRRRDDDKPQHASRRRVHGCLTLSARDVECAQHRADFAQECEFGIDDTVTRDTSSEYLVWPRLLKRVAAKYNLAPCTRQVIAQSSSLARLLETTRRSSSDTRSEEYEAQPVSATNAPSAPSAVDDDDDDDDDDVMVSFAPHFQSDLDVTWSDASRVYSCFVFRKLN
jgi:SAM-dependent methyltransferase